MIDESRVRAAAGTRSLVVSASGLLAAFNDAGVLDEFDVLAASTVGRVLGETADDVLLAAAMVVRGSRMGHVCVRLGDLRESVAVDDTAPDVVDALPWPDDGEWEASVAASRLVGDGSGDEPLVLHHGRLYLERYFRYEERVAGLVAARAAVLGTALDPKTAEMLDRLLGTDAGPGTQRRAAESALTGALTVIAGGPGTGKTYTIGAALAAIAAATGPDAFPRVALCAPTGKAAARLGDAITELAAGIGDVRVAAAVDSVDPSTIHRLLGTGWGRSRFRHNRHNRLPHDLVIVDEMSMVSLPLAAKLLEAVREDAGIVLVGDPFQLESIEAGTVLADIVEPAVAGSVSAEPIAGRVVVLERVFRFEEGGDIDDLADTVRRGDPTAAMDVLRRGSDGVRWIPDRSASDFSDVWERIVARRKRMVDAGSAGDAGAALASLGAIAVLCARREGGEGVVRWRREIEVSLDDAFPGLRYGGAWYPGRPVMITRNDYDLELYNGDIGVAVETDDGLRAVFERGGIRSFEPSRLREHATVHAMTIHKSQGSQFEEVVVVLPDAASRLLTRELLYTAVTRATGRVWLIGSEDVVSRAVERSVQRASGLGPRLWRSVPRAPSP